MTVFDWYTGVVEFLILAGVWYEIYLTLEKRRRSQIKRLVTLTLRRLTLR